MYASFCPCNLLAYRLQMTETRSSNQNYVKDLPVRLRDRTLLLFTKVPNVTKNHLHNAHQKLDYYGLDFQKVQNIAFRIVKDKPCSFSKVLEEMALTLKPLSRDQKRIISELGSFLSLSLGVLLSIVCYCAGTLKLRAL